MVALPNNATSSTLAANATWTAASDDLIGYSNITCQLYADHGSASSGMTFQFSVNDTNFDDVYRFTMSSGTRRFQFPVCARYFRMVYTNGSTAQNAFRVAAYAHKGNVLTSIHRIEDDTKLDRSAQLVKAAVIAQKDGSTDVFTPLTATAGGNLKVAVQEGILSSLGGAVIVRSSAANLLGTVYQSTQADLRATVYQSTAADLNVTVAGYSTTVTVSSLAGAVQARVYTSSGGAIEGSTGTPGVGVLGLHVREALPVRASTSILVNMQTAGGSTTLLSSAAALKWRVYGFSVTSTVVGVSSCAFLSSNKERWGLLLGSGSSGISGANLAVSMPTSLFETDAAEALGFSASSSGLYRVSIAYWQDT
jgi:hypothetical protein